MTAKLAKRLWVLAAACLLLGTLASVHWHKRLPSYNGESLDFWFALLPEVHQVRPIISEGYPQPTARLRYDGEGLRSTGSNRDCAAALKAIRYTGTNALPFLFHKLERKVPSSYLTPALIRRAALRWSVAARLFPDIAAERAAERAQAVAALLALCPLPPDAVQRLRTLSLDFRGPAWSQAGDLLKANEDPRLVVNTLSPYESPIPRPPTLQTIPLN